MTFVHLAVLAIIRLFEMFFIPFDEYKIAFNSRYEMTNGVMEREREERTGEMRASDKVKREEETERERG